jgi:hypothetical protein
VKRERVRVMSSVIKVRERWQVSVTGGWVEGRRKGEGSWVRREGVGVRVRTLELISTVQLGKTATH